MMLNRCLLRLRDKCQFHLRLLCLSMLLLLVMGKEVLSCASYWGFMPLYPLCSTYLVSPWIILAAEDEDLGHAGKKPRPGISERLIEELTDCNASLSQQRKKRQVFLLEFSTLVLLILYIFSFWRQLLFTPFYELYQQHLA